MPDRLYLSPPHMGGRERAYVDEVFATNWIAPVGPMVDRFEAGLASLTGIPNVVALSSGTAALHLALRIIGVGQGDQVWSSTMTFIGGVAPLCYQGAVPLFLDVDPETLLLDLDLTEAALAERRRQGQPLPKVVITTDLYGVPIDSQRLRRLADDYGFCWISDSAESVGSRVDGVHAGHSADFVILSFNGNKIITTSGGGALCCARPGDAERARFLSTQARDPAPHYEHSTYGYNYRMSSLCAAVGLGQLEVLEQRVATRRALYERYRQAFSAVEAISFHREPAGSTANRWLTTIEIDPALARVDREAVRLALEAQNIESRPLWKPMHLQPVFQAAMVVGGVHAAQAFGRGLCLPSGSAMTDEDMERIIGIVLQTMQ